MVNKQLHWYLLNLIVKKVTIAHPHQLFKLERDFTQDTSLALRTKFRFYVSQILSCKQKEIVHLQFFPFGAL